MTVCLTGDVHHMSMETRDQAYMDRTEVEAAIEYAEIAAKYDVPVTLFCTGKCIEEEPDRMERLARMENVELGGHNYWAFTTPIHKGWRVVEKATGGRVGSWMGPRPFQAYEIRKTVSAFDEIGVSITCWRDHAYRYDQYTNELLATNGVTHASDIVNPTGDIREESRVTVVPINTPPDHEHVYHAFRTPEFNIEDEFKGPFGDISQSPDEWIKWVLRQVNEHRNASVVATILAHPACMRLADGFGVFEELCGAVDDAVQMSILSP
jgi:hypothetical protein